MNRDQPRCIHCRRQIRQLSPVVHPVSRATGTIGRGWEHTWNGAVYCRRKYRPNMAEPAR